MLPGALSVRTETSRASLPPTTAESPAGVRSEEVVYDAPKRRQCAGSHGGLTRAARHFAKRKYPVRLRERIAPDENRHRTWEHRSCGRACPAASVRADR